MRWIVYGWILCGMVSFPCRSEASELAEGIVDVLQNRKGDSLNAILEHLHRKFDSSRLSNEDIDSILPVLLKIEESDPFEREQQFKNKTGSVFPNRRAASYCIFDFQCQKISNDLRILPNEQRVKSIMQLLKDPPRLKFSTQSFLKKELVALGADAFPLIIQHAPADPSFGYDEWQVVLAIADIGDERGLPYLHQLWKNSTGQQQVQVAEQIAKIDKHLGIDLLIVSLGDPTWDRVPTNPQQRPGPPLSMEEVRKHILTGKDFSVRWQAVEALKRITEQDFGFVFNEEAKTWKTWLAASGRESFSPRHIERTKQEKQQLVESVMHRFTTSAHFNMSQNTPSIAEDLQSLGPEINSMLADVRADIIEADPIWKDDLNAWTKSLVATVTSK